MGLDVGLRGCNLVLVGGVIGMVFSVAENLAADGPNVALLARDADRGAGKAGRLSGQYDRRVVGIGVDAAAPGDGAIGRTVPGTDRAAAGRETAPCR